MRLLLVILLVINSCLAFGQKALQTQVLVIGGSTGGTSAGIQAARSGAKTIIVEPTSMLGGMLTAAGVSCTDGNYNLHSGIWNEFKLALQKHYNYKSLATGWVSNINFEPKVADVIFKKWVANEKNLTILYGWYLNDILKKGDQVIGAEFINEKGKKQLIYATVIIDATDLGDALPLAGIAYDIGFDDPKETGEKEARKKENIIQDLTWAATLKDYGANADKTIPKPEGYEEKKYYCSSTDAPCNNKPWNGDKNKMLNYGKLPVTGTQNKYMLNWPAHGNDIYLNVVEKKPLERESDFKKARNYTLGFIYFLQTKLGMKNIGLADDELNGGMALIPYHREGRRMQGVIRMNVNHIKNPYGSDLFRTGISVGDYPIDHHHAQYPGKVPPIEFPHVPSYNIPLGALLPANVDGMIVCDKSISVTNIVNGTTRLQPVVLLTGQVAGIMASLSVQQKKQPKNLSVREVQEALLNAKAYLMPYIDIKPDDNAWKAVQKIGATGILRGTGKAEAWANKTFFYPDSTITVKELELAVKENLPSYKEALSANKAKVTQTALIWILNSINNYRAKIIGVKDPAISKLIAPVFSTVQLNEMGLQVMTDDKELTRKEIAVILNHYIDFFKWFNCDIYGKLTLNK